MAESLIKNQVPNNWNRIIKEYETLIKQGRNTNVVIELEDIDTSSPPSSPPSSDEDFESSPPKRNFFLNFWHMMPVRTFQSKSK